MTSPNAYLARLAALRARGVKLSAQALADLEGYVGHAEVETTSERLQSRAIAAYRRG